MVYYPKIATFYYKDKNINIKVPIRVKLIQIKKYECSKCRGVGTISQLIKFFEDKHKGEMIMNKYVPKFGKMMIPEKLLSGSQIICPKCEVVMDPSEQEMLKFYVCSNIKYIDLDRMFNYHTFLKWNKDFHGNLCCFPKNLDKGIDGLNYINEYEVLFKKEKDEKGNEKMIKIKQRRFLNVKIRINRKVDMSLINNELKQYIRRKVADLL